MRLALLAEEVAEIATAGVPKEYHARAQASQGPNGNAAIDDYAAALKPLQVCMCVGVYVFLCSGLKAFTSFCVYVCVLECVCVCVFVCTATLRSLQVRVYVRVCCSLGASAFVCVLHALHALHVLHVLHLCVFCMFCSLASFRRCVEG